MLLGCSCFSTCKRHEKKQEDREAEGRKAVIQLSDDHEEEQIGKQIGFLNPASWRNDRRERESEKAGNGSACRLSAGRIPDLAAPQAPKTHLHHMDGPACSRSGDVQRTRGLCCRLLFHLSSSRE